VQAQQDELAAAIAADRAADDLLLLMGEEPGQDLVPATPIGEVPPLTLEVDAAVEVGMAQNLDLAVARAEVEMARSDHAQAKHGKLPLLSATASAGIGATDTTPGGAISGIFKEDAFPFVTLGGEFSVPLGNRALKGQEQQAGAALYRSELDLESLERTIRSQVEHQVLLLQQAGRTVELADVNVRLADETLAAEEALERAGRAIQKDVLEARTAVFRARAEAAKARADYRLAQTELLRLQGQIDLAVP
jgi:outer membrane protein TolC